MIATAMVWEKAKEYFFLLHSVQSGKGTRTRWKHSNRGQKYPGKDATHSGSETSSWVKIIKSSKGNYELQMERMYLFSKVMLTEQNEKTDL